MRAEFAVAAFYKFTRLDDPGALREPLLGALAELDARGTVLLAREGVNGTLSMPPGAWNDAIAALRGLPGCDDLSVRRSRSEGQAFRRLKVRLKEEIVRMGIAAADPTCAVGDYVAPADWNALISDRETLVIDTRNAYEVALGTFAHAIDPNTDSFTAFPTWLDEHVARATPKRIAMFCTGGIRCEKATSYAKMVGLERVHHLKGGILAYLESVPAEDSLWRGECFVFDERVSLTHGLETGRAVMCRACKFPVSEHDQTHHHYKAGISCPNCFDATSPEQKARFAERQRQIERAEAEGRAHLAGDT
jgi:UPF0176 protein